jgi:hypothetical protein
MVLCHCHMFSFIYIYYLDQLLCWSVGEFLCHIPPITYFISLNKCMIYSVYFKPFYDSAKHLLKHISLQNEKVKG